MGFGRITKGSQCFIDGNVLIYHATADPVYGAAAKQLMTRIARREIQGFTSTHGLCDLAHRVMTTDAMVQLGWPAKGIAPRLRRNPTQVQKLTRFRQAVEEIPQIGIQALPVDFQLG